jgi:hypothetical protein
VNNPSKLNQNAASSGLTTFSKSQYSRAISREQGFDPSATSSGVSGMKGQSRNFCVDDDVFQFRLANEKIRKTAKRVQSAKCFFERFVFVGAFVAKRLSDVALHVETDDADFQTVECSGARKIQSERCF